VVIPCRNEARSIGALLDALASQTVPPSDVIVVDDRSSDDTASVVRQWHRAHPGVAVRLLTGLGRGPGPAMNAGIEASASEVVVRLDGHSIPDPGYIEHSLNALASPTVGVVGGYWSVQPGAETAVGRAIALVVSHPLGSGGARYRHPNAAGPDTRVVETVPFGAFRRSLWVKLGGFDEALSANQDFDFNYRARVAGFQVLLDRRIRAIYRARPTLGALARQYVRYGYWKLQMLRKDPRAVHWRQGPPVLVLPWLFVTTIQAAAWPSPLSFLLASVYPAVLLAGSAHLATRGAHAGAAFAALVTVQLGWSAGFWRGLLGGRPPVR